MPSLNNVVSSLVRAAASVPADISDADLDAHVARLLADEARAKESQWGELGLGAFLRREQRDSPDPSVPKPNKRFLASVIRNVDGHNASLLRAQAESAQGARNEFEDARRGDSKWDQRPRRDRGDGDGQRHREWDRRRDGGDSENGGRGESSRAARAGTGGKDRTRMGAGSAAARLFGGAMMGVARLARDDAGKSKGGGRDHESPSCHEREGSGHRGARERNRDEDGRRKDGRRGRDGAGERDREDARNRRHRDGDLDREGRSGRDRAFNRDRARGYRDSERGSGSPRSARDDGDRRSHRRSASPADHGHRRDQPCSRSRSRSPGRPPSSSPPPPPRSPPPPARGRRRSPPSRVASKMDRYFSETYDPRLDFEDAVVPASGPVMDVGWDNMLAVLKERGSKSPGLSASPEPVRKTKDERREAREAKEALRAARTSQMRRARNGESDDERERRRARKRDKERKRLDELGRAPAGDDDKDKEQDGAMDRDRDLVDVIGWKYTKKGGTREWDVGKET